MRPLFSTLYGSYLYGTNTPTSDLDRKIIVLPTLDELLLCKKVTNKVKRRGDHDGVDKSAVLDEEQIPLQVFARDFLEGQTYALELAFAVPMSRRAWYKDVPSSAQAKISPYPYCEGYDVAPNPNHAQQTFYSYGDLAVTDLLPEMVAELKERFLTKNLKALMGYAVHQASLYSVKGARLNALNEAVKVIGGFGPGNRLGNVVEQVKQLEQLAESHPKYVKVTTYDIGSGRTAPCLVLLEKTFPFTDEKEHVMGRLNALTEKYGERAQAARVDEVDWKATMHALRVLDEGLDLMHHGSLNFPYRASTVKRYLAVKRGEVSYAEVTEELNDRLEKLKTMEVKSKLPDLTPELREKFEGWFALWLRRFYNLNTVASSGYAVWGRDAPESRG